MYNVNMLKVQEK